MSIYRRLYEQAHGPIPKDENGRTYDIHHIDGNRKNNDPSNLIALSIEEHYKVHYDQGDYGACWLLSRKMKMTIQELSDLSKTVQKERIDKGVHHFLTLAQKRVDEGTHPFLDKDFQSIQGKKGYKKAIEKGTHFSLTGDFRKIASKRIEDGSHPFLDSEIQRKNVMRSIENGTHSSCKTHTCPYCGKVGKGASMKMWHFDKCRSKV